jgi:hypothetical protein
MSTAAALDPQQVLAVACALVHNGGTASADELELALLDAYGIDINSFASLLAALAREGLLSPIDSPALPAPLHPFP